MPPRAERMLKAAGEVSPAQRIACPFPACALWFPAKSASTWSWMSLAAHLVVHARETTLLTAREPIRACPACGLAVDSGVALSLERAFVASVADCLAGAWAPKTHEQAWTAAQLARPAPPLPAETGLHKADWAACVAALVGLWDTAGPDDVRAWGAAIRFLGGPPTGADAGGAAGEAAAALAATADGAHEPAVVHAAAAGLLKRMLLDLGRDALLEAALRRERIRGNSGIDLPDTAAAAAATPHRRQVARARHREPQQDFNRPMVARAGDPAAPAWAFPPPPAEGAGALPRATATFTVLGDRVSQEPTRVLPRMVAEGVAAVASPGAAGAAGARRAGAAAAAAAAAGRRRGAAAPTAAVVCDGGGSAAAPVRVLWQYTLAPPEQVGGGRSFAVPARHELLALGASGDADRRVTVWQRSAPRAMRVPPAAQPAPPPPPPPPPPAASGPDYKRLGVGYRSHALDSDSDSDSSGSGSAGDGEAAPLPPPPAATKRSRPPAPAPAPAPRRAAPAPAPSRRAAAASPVEDPELDSDDEWTVFAEGLQLLEDAADERRRRFEDVFGDVFTRAGVPPELEASDDGLSSSSDIPEGSSSSSEEEEEDEDEEGEEEDDDLPPHAARLQHGFLRPPTSFRAWRRLQRDAKLVETEVAKLDAGVRRGLMPFRANSARQSLPASFYFIPDQDGQRERARAFKSVANALSGTHERARRLRLQRDGFYTLADPAERERAAAAAARAKAQRTSRRARKKKTHFGDEDSDEPAQAAPQVRYRRQRPAESESDVSDGGGGGGGGGVPAAEDGEEPAPKRVRRTRSHKQVVPVEDLYRPRLSYGAQRASETSTYGREIVGRAWRPAGSAADDEWGKVVAYSRRKGQHQVERAGGLEWRALCQGEVEFPPSSSSGGSGGSSGGSGSDSD